MNASQPHQLTAPSDHDWRALGIDPQTTGKLRSAQALVDNYGTADCRAGHDPDAQAELAALADSAHGMIAAGCRQVMASIDPDATDAHRREAAEVASYLATAAESIGCALRAADRPF